MDGVNYKFLMAEHAHGNAEGSMGAGSIIAANPAEGLVVACGKGAVRLSRLQKQGKAAMDDMTFLRGNNLPEGAAFENK
jgi:methionyl-tRNA formyltransferase